MHLLCHHHNTEFPSDGKKQMNLYETNKGKIDVIDCKEDGDDRHIDEREINYYATFDNGNFLNRREEEEGKTKKQHNQERSNATIEVKLHCTSYYYTNPSSSSRSSRNKQTPREKNDKTCLEKKTCERALYFTMACMDGMYDTMRMIVQPIGKVDHCWVGQIPPCSGPTFSTSLKDIIVHGGVSEFCRKELLHYIHKRVFIASKEIK